nr:DUF134 domain-containing protein [uncultured Bacteroides sp.]
MARTKKNRLIQMAPHFNGFKPQGLQHKQSAEVLINFEEYEALKLCDYELLTQAEAADLMLVSRPTFTRIYESVRRKIAKAFIEGASIVFEGGNVDVVHWYRCAKCEIVFTLVDDSAQCCPLCKSLEIKLNN